MTATRPTSPVSAFPRSDRPAQPGAGRPVRASAGREIPQVSEDYAHLTLDALRGYRRALQDEEGKVSYWRRIIQARLDVVRAGSSHASGHFDPDRLAPVLAEHRVTAGRTALIEVLPVDDIPPLPDLADLWERRTAEGDAVALAALEQDLAVAESQLSAYRAALHARLAEATGQLIARYREQPSLCLTALPLPEARRAS
jgi:hypothetical protein